MSAPAPTSSPISRVRLAVVDDHAIIRGVFVTLVEDAPELNMAWTASSLAEAADKIQLDIPDILVIDVGLPDGNGFDFTKELLTRVPGLPVLIVSADTESSYVERAAASGAKGFIAKEASLELLVEAVNTIQQGGQWFHPAG
ncbi:response regulator transcription factor [Prosthecobacter sp.]|uniref:response regulator n=1 Tax=Prosthecobacter sp. TaxID=1965333 RepID=UPI0024895135|nr:response regulator transcription factor [Prosthecobacter sp.]MDI1312866.1 response regulator transcription factor [Prosthecobacter sp.]